MMLRYPLDIRTFPDQSQLEPPTMTTATACLLFLLVPAITAAHESEEITNPHVPQRTPDRIILTYTSDPATTQAVTWRTAPGAGTPQAEFAPATGESPFGDRMGFAAAAVTVYAETEALETELGETAYHSVEFFGLGPETLYAYRVGDGEIWSEWFHFRTASRDPKPFTFVYVGDAQNNLKSLWSRTVRQAYSQARPQLLIHAGDLVNVANSDSEWGEWFYAAGWINGMIPSIPVPGNHEYSSGLSRNWRPSFALPKNGPDGLEETTYFIDYQGVRFVGLNSNEQQEAQAEWLDRILADNPNTWTVATFHHPIFSAARGRDNQQLRNLWMPILDKYRVDLVLQGHDHTYGRTGNVREGVNVRNDQSGTVYVVSVSGPKMYSSAEHPLMVRVGEDLQLYQVITIDANKLSYESRTATGDLYDAFELHKQESGSNKLVPTLPADIQENRR